MKNTQKTNRKTYILDTNVLLSDPTSIFSFEDNNVIIPLAVLEELDNHKSRQDDVGRNARQIGRSLDDLRLEGSLFEGIQLANGGTLKVATANFSHGKGLPLELQTGKVDNMLIAFMMQYVGDDNHIMVSKDINVRLKCDSLNIKCEDYLKMRITDDPEKFYRGVEVVEVSAELVERFYKDGEVELPAYISEQRMFYPNQIIVLKNVNQSGESKSGIAKYKSNGKPVVAIEKFETVQGLKPRNKEQLFSLDLLFDNSIKLLTMTGAAGCGKTILALAAALEQLKGFGRYPTYDKLIVTRPIQPLGHDLGFLPGTLEEKMDPWIAPIRDNINFLMSSQKALRMASTASSNKGKSASGERRSDRQPQTFKTNDYLQIMQDNGSIEIEAITYIRGRSIPNAIIIIDESQNLTMHELKTIITRVGEGTKIILTGDIEQIDNIHVDAYTNGLTYAIEKFKDYPIAGHVTLLKGERSLLASIAAKIL